MLESHTWSWKLQEKYLSIREWLKKFRENFKATLCLQLNPSSGRASSAWVYSRLSCREQGRVWTQTKCEQARRKRGDKRLKLLFNNLLTSTLTFFVISQTNHEPRHSTQPASQLARPANSTQSCLLLFEKIFFPTEKSPAACTKTDMVCVMMCRVECSWLAAGYEMNEWDGWQKRMHACAFKKII